MKYITILFILISFNSYCQDTLRTPTGYEIDYAHICVKVDTVHHMSQFYHFYPHKVYVSINGGKAVLMKRREPRTVWAESFTVTVTRNEYKRIYQF